MTFIELNGAIRQFITSFVDIITYICDIICVVYVIYFTLSDIVLIQYYYD